MVHNREKLKASHWKSIVSYFQKVCRTDDHKPQLSQVFIVGQRQCLRASNRNTSSINFHRVLDPKKPTAYIIQWSEGQRLLLVISLMCLCGNNNILQVRIHQLTCGRSLTAILLSELSRLLCIAGYYTDITGLDFCVRMNYMGCSLLKTGFKEL